MWEQIVDFYLRVKSGKLYLKEKVDMAMSQKEKEEFKNRAKAMSEEEWEIMLEIIPVKMCLARIEKELDNMNQLQAAVGQAVKLISIK